MIKNEQHITTAPGEAIKEQLENKKLSPADFTWQMHMLEQTAFDMLNDNSPLSSVGADQLQIVLGVPSDFWNRLETNYRENLAVIAEENACLFFDFAFSKTAPLY